MTHERRTDWLSGRSDDIGHWLKEGRHAIDQYRGILFDQHLLRPDTLAGISGYGEFVHRPEIHPLLWTKPGVLEYCSGAPKCVLRYMGPSASGKDTILQMAKARHPDLLTMVVTHTTRSPRPDEVDGTTYHFTDPRTFQTMLKAKKFIEYIRINNKVIGRTDWYGTSRASLDGAISSAHRFIIWRGEYNGAVDILHDVGRNYPGTPCPSLFILPEISLRTLSRRIYEKRGKGDATWRVVKAMQEIVAGGNADIFLSNPIELDGPAQATEAFISLLHAFQSQEN